MATVYVTYQDFLDNGPFNSGDNVILQDSSDVLQGLTAGQLADLASGGIDVIDSLDDFLALSVAQYQALIGQIAFDPSDLLILVDTGANIGASYASFIAQLAAQGVASVNPSDGVLTLSLTKFDALGAMALDAGSVVTLKDTGANLSALSVARLQSLAGLGVDILDASDNALTLSIAQVQALGAVSIAGNDALTMADTGANIAALSASQIAALEGIGVTKIDATDNVLDLSVAQYQGLGSVILVGADTVTLKDTGANIAALDATAFGGLSTSKIDAIDASDNALSLTVAQYQALGSVVLTAGDEVTLADTGANIAALGAGAMSGLATANVDAIDASDDALSLTVAQYLALGSVTLAAGDTVTLKDTGANLATLTANQIAGLAAAGVDAIDVTDTVLTLSLTKAQALVTPIGVGDSIEVTGTASAIEALTAADINALAAKGVNQFMPDGPLTLTSFKVAALVADEITLDGATATLSDTSAHITALTSDTFAGLAAAGVTRIDVTDGALSLSLGDYLAAGVTFSNADTITIVGSDSDLSSLSLGDFETMLSRHVDAVKITGGALTLTLSDVQSLSGLNFMGSLTVSADASDLAALTTGDLQALVDAGVDALGVNASTGALALTVAQGLTIAGQLSILANGADVTVTGTDGEIGDLTAGQIAAFGDAGVTALLAQDGSLSLTVAQAEALGGVSVTDNASVTLADTSDTVGGLSTTRIAALGAHGVTSIHTTDDVLNLSIDQAVSVADAGISIDGAVTAKIVDTVSDFAALTGEGIADLKTAGFAAYDLGSDPVNLTVDQYQALISAHAVLYSGTVTLADSEANLSSLSPDEVGDMAGFVSVIDSTDGAISFDAAQLSSFNQVSLAAGDTLVFADTEATIEAQLDVDLADLVTKGVTVIHATDTGVLNLSEAQYAAIAGSVTFPDADTVTVGYDATALTSFDQSDFDTLAGFGVDAVDIGSADLSLSAAQAAAMIGDGLSIDSTGTVTVVFGFLDFSAYSSLLGDLKAAGFDRFTGDTSVIQLTLEQFQSLEGSGLPIYKAQGTYLFVIPSSEQLSALDATELAKFPAFGVDYVSTYTGTVTMTVAELAAMGSTQISNPNLYITDTGANIAAMGGTALELAYQHDSIHGLDATDNVLNLDAGSAAAITDRVAYSHIAAEDVATLADSNANIASKLSDTEFSRLASAGFDAIDASDDVLTLTLSRYQSLGSVALTQADSVTVTTDADGLTSLSGSDIAAMGEAGVDFLGFGSADVVLTADQAKGLADGGVGIKTTGTVTVADSYYGGLTASEISALHDLGVQVFSEPSNGVFLLSLQQFQALNGISIAAGPLAEVHLTYDEMNDLIQAGGLEAFSSANIDYLLLDGTGQVVLSVSDITALGSAQIINASVRLSDTGANIEGLGAEGLQAAFDQSVDVIDASDNVLNFTAAEAEVLAQHSYASIASDDEVTLVDTAAHIAGLSQYRIASLATVGFDLIDVTDTTLTLSVAQTQALGGLQLANGDVLIVSDTAEILEALTANDLADLGAAGAASLKAIDGALTFTADQAEAVFAAGMVIDAATSATVQADPAAVSSSEIADYANAGFDILQNVDGGATTYSASIAQAVVDHGMTVAAGDLAHVDVNLVSFSELTGDQIAAFGAAGFVVMDVDDGSPTLTADQYLGFGEIILSGSENGLSDTAAHIQALTTRQLQGLSTQGIHYIFASAGALTLSYDQTLAISDQNKLSNIVLTDAAIVVDGLDVNAIGGLGALGVTAIDANGAVLSVAQALALGDVVFLGANTVTLFDAAEAIQDLTPFEIEAIAAANIDTIDSASDALVLSVDQVTALGAMSFAQSDTVTIRGTVLEISGMTAGQMAAAGAAHVYNIVISDPENDLKLKVDQAEALATGGIIINSTGAIVLSDSAENISAMTADQIADLEVVGIQSISSSDGPAALTVAQFEALSSVVLNPGDGDVLTDTADNLQGMDPSEIARLADYGFAHIAISGEGTLAFSASQITSLGDVTVAEGTVLEWSLGAASLGEDFTVGQIADIVAHGVTLVDAGVNAGDYAHVSAIGPGASYLADNSIEVDDTAVVLDGLTRGQIEALAAQNVDRLHGDAALSLTVDQMRGLGAMTVSDTAGVVTLTDTGAHLAGMTVEEVGALAGQGFTAIDASDDSLSFTVGQAAALGSVALTSGDSVTLSDTGAAIEALTSLQLEALADAGFTAIDASDDVLDLTVAQYQALGAIALTSGDTVVLKDAASAFDGLMSSDWAALHSVGVDSVEVTSGTLTISGALYGQLDGLTFLTGHGGVVLLSDTAVHLQGLVAETFSDFAATGIEGLVVEDGSAVFSADQIQAIIDGGLTVQSGTEPAGAITVSDQGATLAGLDFTALSAAGVTGLDASDDQLSLSIAQFGALGALTLSADDTVTLTGTGEELAAFDYSAVSSSHHVDLIDASDDQIAVGLDQFTAIALSGAAFAPADTVTLILTASEIEQLGSEDDSTFVAANVDVVQAGDGEQIHLDVDQATGLMGAGLKAFSSQGVILSDDGEVLSAQDDRFFSGLAAAGFTAIDSTTDELSLSLGAYSSIAGVVALTDGDSVTVQGSQSDIYALDPAVIAGMHANGVDTLYSTTNGWILLTAAQVLALNGVAIGSAASNSNELRDTWQNLSAVTAEQWAEIGAVGIQRIDSSNGGTVSWSIDQAVAVGEARIEKVGGAYISGTAAAIEALTADQIALTTSYVDGVLHVTNGSVALSVEQFRGLSNSGGMVATASGEVILSDTEMALEAVSDFSGLASAGFDRVDSTDDVLNLTVGQVNSLGGVTLTDGDTVTLADTGENIAVMSVGELGALAGLLVDVIDATDDALSLSVAQLQALGGVAVSSSDVLTLADSAQNLETLDGDGFAALVAVGVDIIHVTDGELDLTVDQLTGIGHTATFVAGDTVVLHDAAASIEGMSAEDLSALGLSGVDSIESATTPLVFDLETVKALAFGGAVVSGGATASGAATDIADLTPTEIARLDGAGFTHLSASDGARINLDVAQYQALGHIYVNLPDTAQAVVLQDSAANISAMTVEDLAGLSAAGFTFINYDANMVLSAAQAEAGAGLWSNGYLITIVDTGEAISGLSASVLHMLDGYVRALDATDDAISLSIDQLNALGDIGFTSGDVITLADNRTNLSGLDASVLTAYAARGVTEIHVTNSPVYFNADQTAAILDSSLTIVSGDTANLADGSSNIQALTATQFGQLAAHGFDAIDTGPADNVLALKVDQYQALGAVTLASGMTVTLKDSGANVAALSATDLSLLASKNVDKIDLTDDAASLTMNQLRGSSVNFSSGDAITIYDTGANIAEVDAAGLGVLAARHVTVIDASDDVLTLTVAQFDALAGITLAAGDLVTIQDSGANIATLDFSTLAAANVDVIDSTADVVSLTVTQLNALGSVSLAAGDSVTLADSAANLQALTAGNFTTYAGQGVDTVHSTTSSTLSLTAAQAAAIIATNMVAASDDTVTLSDSSANILALTTTQLGLLASHGIDSIHSTTGNALTLTVAKVLALGSVTLASGDTVTLGDTATNLQGLTASQIQGLAATGVDKINSTSTALSLSVDQYSALGTVALTSGNTVTLKDTGANLAALSATQIGQLAGKFVDFIDASDDVLTLSAAQFAALGTVALKAADLVTVSDTGANLATLSPGAFASLAAKNVDVIDASDNVLNLTVAQVTGLGSLSLSAGDLITVVDTGANIAGMTAVQIAALAGINVDAIDARDDVINLTAAQMAALGTVTVAAGDLVTLSDTSDHIAAISALAFADYRTLGLDRVSSDSDLALSAAQAVAIYDAGLTLAHDAVVISVVDAGANLSALTAAQIGHLSSLGVTVMDASDDAFSLSVAQFDALGDIVLTGADTITLADNSEVLQALDPAVIQGLATAGIDVIHATDGALSVSLAQVNALGGVVFEDGDLVTLSDAEATLEAADLSGLLLKGIDALASTSGMLNLSASQLLSLVGVQIEGDLNLSDSAANLQVLSASDFGAILIGVDKIFVDEGAVSLKQPQAVALADSGAAFDSGQSVTVYDTGANLALLNATEIAALAAANVTLLDASDDSLVLDVAQYGALGGIALAGDDVVVLADTGEAIGGLTPTGIEGLDLAGFASIDATDDVLTLSYAQFAALGTVALAGADLVTVTIDAQTLQGLSAAQFALFPLALVDKLAVSGDVTVDLADLNALGDTPIVSSDAVVLADTAATLSGLSTGDISDLALLGVTSLKVTDGHTLALDWDQFSALGAIGLTPADDVSLSASAADIAGLDSNTIATIVADGVDLLISTDGQATLTLDQIAGLTGVSFSQADAVTITGSGADFAGLSDETLFDYGLRNVDYFDAGTDAFDVTADYALHLAASGIEISSGVATVSDSAEAIDALTPEDLTAIARAGVLKVDSSDVLTIDVDQALALIDTPLVYTGSTEVVLSDSAANIQSLTGEQLAVLNLDGVDSIQLTGSEATLTVSLDQFDSLDSIALPDAATITLADTATALEALQASDVQALAGKGIDIISATGDGDLAVTYDQYQALGGVVFDPDNTVTLRADGATLAGLGYFGFFAAGEAGIDILDATDNELRVSNADINAIFNAHLRLSPDDTVVVADTGANLHAYGAVDIENLHDFGVSAFASTLGAWNMTVDTAAAILQQGMTVEDSTTAVILDTGANIAGLTVDQIGALKDAGIDTLNAYDDVLTLSLAQINALGGVTLTQGDMVTLADTGANLETLINTQIMDLQTLGVDVLHATDGALTLTYSVYAALDAVALTPDDVVTLVIPSQWQFDQLTWSDIDALAGRGIDFIHAAEGQATLTWDQYTALGTVKLIADDSFTVTADSVTVAGLSASDITGLADAGVDMIDVTDDVATIGYDPAVALADSGLVFDASDTVTIAATGADLASLTTDELTALSAAGVDRLDASDDVLTLSLAQFRALGAIQLTDGDTVSLSLDASDVEAMSSSDLSAVAAAYVDKLEVTGALTLTLTQFLGAGFMTIVDSDTVTLAGSGADLATFDTGSIGALAGRGIDVVDLTDNAITLTLAQATAFGTVKFAADDLVTISDTGAHLSALTHASLFDLRMAGVDQIDATDNELPLTVDAWIALWDAGLEVASDDSKIVADTEAHLDFLSAADLANFAIHGIASITSTTGDWVIDTDVAKALLTSGIALDVATTVTVQDDGSALAGLTAGQIAGLDALGVKTFDAADDVLSLTVAQYEALGGIALDATDTVTMADTGDNLGGLSAEQIAGLHDAGVSVLDATDDVLLLTAAQYSALGGVTLTAEDTVSLVDTGANLAAMTQEDYASLTANGVDVIDASDDVLVLSLAEYGNLGDLKLAAADDVTIADSSEALSALTTGQLAALAAAGVDHLQSTDADLTTDVATVIALGAMTYTGPATVTLADSESAIEGLTAATLADFAHKGVDRIDSTDDTLNPAADQVQAIINGGLTIVSGDSVTVVDTGAAIAAISAEQFGALAAVGIDALDASDDTLDLTVAQYQALNGVTLAGSDYVTLRDTGANLAFLTASDIAALHGAGIAAMDASDDALSLSLAQFNALGAVTLASGDIVSLADTGSALAGLSLIQMAALLPAGIDVLDSTTDVLSLTLNQVNILDGITFAAGDAVTAADTAAKIRAISAAGFADYAAQGVDLFHSTTGDITLDASQVSAMKTAGLGISSDDTAILADTSANLGNVGYAGLADMGIDRIDATDNALTLSVLAFNNLAGVAFTAGDVVVVKDTGAKIATLDFSLVSSKGVYRIDATDDALNLTKAQLDALGSTLLTQSDTVTLKDIGANIAAYSGSDLTSLKAKGVDRIDSTTNALALSISQAFGLNGIALTAADVVTLTDTGANLGALTSGQLTTLRGLQFDALDATDDSLTLSIAQLTAIGGMALTSSDTVTLSDVGAAIAAISTADMSAYAAKGVDIISASDGSLSVTKAQVNALGSAKFNGANIVTLADASANIQAMTSTSIAALAGKGVDKIDATDDQLALTTAQFNALGAVALTASDTVTLADTGANLATLTTSVLAAKGVDQLDASNNVLNLTVARYEGLGAVKLTQSDTVTLLDTGAHLKAMSAGEIGGLAAAGVDRLDATNDSWSITAAQYKALGTVTIAAADTVVMIDTGANIASMTTAQIGALAATGVDRLNASDDVLALNVAQYQALGAVSLTAADAVTLADTGANLAALTASQIGALAAAGIDKLNASDDQLSLSVAQYQALGTVTLAGADVVTLSDTGAHLSALTASQIAALAAGGVDKLNATDGTLTLTVAQYQALGAVALTGANTVVLADTEANLEAVTTGQLSALAAKGIDRLDATDDHLSLSVAQYLALGAVSLTDADATSVTDTGAHLAGMTGVQFASLSAHAVDHVDATDNVLNLNFNQFNNLIPVLTSADDLVTVTGNSGDNIINGLAGDQTLVGGDGADILYGGAGNDTLNGGAGDDVLVGGAGADVLNGGAGKDTASYVDATAGVTVSLTTSGAQATGWGADRLISIENLTGSSFSDNLHGDENANVLSGGDGDDVITAAQGADTLIGGAGLDTLTGGQGADTFVYQATSDSLFGHGDVITDFVSGLDQISLSAIDADTGADGMQSFSFIGTADFSHHAGELRYVVSGGAAHVQVDTNGDGVADMEINLTGVTTLSSSDFILS